MTRKPLTVLVEMRPTLEGFAGIPQETRLLFRGLTRIDGVKVQGLLQHPTRRLTSGVKARTHFWQQRLTPATEINRYSRVVISLAEKPYATMLDKVRDYLERRIESAGLLTRATLRLSVKFTQFKPDDFKDFVWRTMFAKTLPASDFDAVTRCDFKICATPWKSFQNSGLYSLNFVEQPIYPRLDTRGIDIFVGQTPYPAAVTRDTRLVIRYHDAIPVLMPHTIADKANHQAMHVYALRANARAGAWFACVSEATRQDLLKIHPEVADRAVTIHNMVSHHYFNEDSNPKLVQGIVRSRLYEGDLAQSQPLMPTFLSNREKESFYNRVLSADKPFKYALMVSTIEPRKNHTRLLAAWEVIKADIDPDLKLVVVGTLGWETKAIAQGFKEWIDRGEVFMLHAVPAPDLRVLYKHAAVTVCPSLGEGFDFSGVESMASGGVVVASDIPVHDEVYQDAALYFDPYSTASLVKAVKQVLYDDQAPRTCERLRQRGQEIAARYHADVIMPQWDAFLQQVAAAPARRPAGAVAQDPRAAVPVTPVTPAVLARRGELT